MAKGEGQGGARGTGAGDRPAVEARGLDRLVAIMRRLLGPGGCPWDREQTHETLRPYLVEETYEVLDAIDGGDPAELRDELGDLLLQIVFHAELARLEGTFDIDDVVDAISDKLERRHPHVFGSTSVETADEVATQWERLKRQEGSRSPLAGIPRSLPALRRAHRFGERLAKVGFDWPDASGPRAKVDEELAELDEALAAGDDGRAEAELGDLLLAVSSLSRHHGIEAEDALRRALDRFGGRYEAVEERLRARGLRAEACTLAELDQLWEAEKDRERRGG